MILKISYAFKNLLVNGKDSNKFVTSLWSLLPPDIKPLILVDAGTGSFMQPTAAAITEYLVRHDINTEAVGECDVACAQIFLEGEA